ncbi:FAD-binding and (Fe-S)-binding domain-containing protein [Mycolicibacterium sp.]|uniref:FAD-binding and (Fe-S)-binding domain-containing protein n=1 Tax=Mycolicibacterium sp. TaxID=2320850 RepID=UPI003D0ABCDD
MSGSPPDPAALAGELRRAGVADVLHDDGSRGQYSSDASLYRIVPSVVVRPHDADEVAATLAVAHATSTPVTARGGGTSVAGNAIGPGIVVDFSRHMTRIIGIDPEAGTATVQPGVVHAQLQARARGHGLIFGPDPSTVSRCTVGGMIGNNACGSRSLGYGRTSDNVRRLAVVTADGTTLDVVSGADAIAGNHGAAQARLAALRSLVARELGLVRTEFGRFGRQVSGYAVEHLLPENRFDVAKFLVGTEGTLGIVTEATVDLVREPPHRLLIVLGFPDMPSAADATPGLLTFRPSACEGLDARIVGVVRARRGAAAVPTLPGGDAWLMVELSGEHPGELAATADRLVTSTGCVDASAITDAAEAAALWRIRADGAGLSGRGDRNQPAHAGWEDAAVPPQKLGAYLRDFEKLTASYELAGYPFGHFGDGCMHVRLDFDLVSTPGVARFEAFLRDAADLVARYGGSLSGEHGDGRARSALLDRMYSPAALRLFAEIKMLFDPANLLNPGIVADPGGITDSLRLPSTTPITTNLAFGYHDDHGDFREAVHRCTGVGKCRATTTDGVMCPSYVATRNEKDSTRGRARILQELTNGTLVPDWSSPAIHDSLDLCLACKGCASDCPTGVDMATYKSEVLHQTYKGSIRPASHYALGQLPRWVRIASAAPALANTAMRAPGLSSVALRMGGVDPRRSIPPLARHTFRREHQNRDSATRPEAVLFIDTFTNYFSPAQGHSAVRVLDAAGFSAVIIPKQRCCGLTWITTGQLDAAKRILTRTIADLLPFAERGVPIVGLEPSCSAVLRSDAPDLLATRSATVVAEQVVTLAELLDRHGWQPPDLHGQHVVAQPHCHHHAIFGWDTDERLLTAAGAEVTKVAGCCGLAGNFGVERGHYEVSVAVADQHLLPTVRANPASVVLADGFSCRTQLSDLASRSSMHLAEVLEAGLRERNPNG